MKIRLAKLLIVAAAALLCAAAQSDAVDTLTMIGGAAPESDSAFVGGLAIQFSPGRALDEDAEPYLRRHQRRNQGKGFNYVSFSQGPRPTGAVFATGRY
jgi:hypothetical protein